MTFIDKLLEVAKVNMKTTFAYVAVAWGSFIVTVIQIFVFFYIWKAIYNGQAMLNGLTRDQITTYIILSRVIYTQVSWSYIYWLGQKIQTGEISMDLLRPIDFQLYMYVGRIGDIFAFSLMTAVPAILVTAGFLGMYVPHNPITILYFIISLLLAISIAFFIEFAIGLMAFYTSYTWGLGIFHEALIQFFSGAIVPIVFFPGWLKAIVNVLPFKDIMYTPIAIYLGIIKGGNVFESLLFQCFWILALFLISRIIYLVLIKKVTVQGG